MVVVVVIGYDSGGVLVLTLLVLDSTELDEFSEGTTKSSFKFILLSSIETRLGRFKESSVILEV